MSHVKTGSARSASARAPCRVLAAGRLSIDFVTHGDEGVAGPWAARAVAGDTLAAAASEWPAGTQVFAHGERESVKAVRGVLRERAVPRESLSISAYWARGRTEDVFQAEKREPIGQIN
ncbi:SIP domain-containing protein [Nocardioides sp.]|uniref:SIP domain-containing protein n=1 Tax=Nocardioides sp. TaxID=35761 RepID=UPI0039E33C94